MIERPSHCTSRGTAACRCRQLALLLRCWAALPRGAWPVGQHALRACASLMRPALHSAAAASVVLVISMPWVRAWCLWWACGGHACTCAGCTRSANRQWAVLNTHHHRCPDLHSHRPTACVLCGLLWCRTPLCMTALSTLAAPTM